MSIEGRKLFFAMNCYGCHKIEGMCEGTLGPDLTEAGKKFKIDYLWESIVDPRANLRHVVHAEVQPARTTRCKALVIFLKSRRGMNFAETSLDRYQAQPHGGRSRPASGQAAAPAPPSDAGRASS